jgi:hypothetical protein
LVITNREDQDQAYRRCAVISTIGSVFFVGSAAAADMTGAQIRELLSGKSIYQENTATSSGGAGQGVIYYAADENAEKIAP